MVATPAREHVDSGLARLISGLNMTALPAFAIHARVGSSLPGTLRMPPPRAPRHRSCGHFGNAQGKFMLPADANNAICREQGKVQGKKKQKWIAVFRQSRAALCNAWTQEAF